MGTNSNSLKQQLLYVNIHRGGAIGGSGIRAQLEIISGRIVADRAELSVCAHLTAGAGDSDRPGNVGFDACRRYGGADADVAAALVDRAVRQGGAGAPQRHVIRGADSRRSCSRGRCPRVITAQEGRAVRGPRRREAAGADAGQARAGAAERSGKGAAGDCAGESR